MTPPDGAFKALMLLLLVGGLSAGIVPSPTNLNVDCQNLRVTVSWDYSNRQPDAVFRVSIVGAIWCHVAETREHQYDLTHLIWASEERYMDNFYVTVAATLAGNQSDQVQSQTFSFNWAKTINLTCKLDFPPVALNRKESVVTLSFSNPFHLYSELKHAAKPASTIFDFTATSSAGHQSFTCSVEEENCKHDLVFPDAVEECVTLDGVLFSGSRVGQVWFRKTGLICVSLSAEVDMAWPVIALVVTILIISGISVLICKVRTYTMENTVILPKPLLVKPGEGDIYDNEPEKGISIVGLVAGPKKTPSVSSEEFFQDRPDRMFLEGGNQELEAASHLEWHRTDEDSADDSEKTSCVFIDSEEEGERSGYDCQHVLHVDMGDGDTVTGYKG